MSVPRPSPVFLLLCSSLSLPRRDRPPQPDRVVSRSPYESFTAGPLHTSRVSRYVHRLCSYLPWRVGKTQGSLVVRNSLPSSFHEGEDNRRPLFLHSSLPSSLFFSVNRAVLPRESSSPASAETSLSSSSSRSSPDHLGLCRLSFSFFFSSSFCLFFFFSALFPLCSWKTSASQRREGQRRNRIVSPCPW